MLWQLTIWKLNPRIWSISGCSIFFRKRNYCINKKDIPTRCGTHIDFCALGIIPYLKLKFQLWISNRYSVPLHFCCPGASAIILTSNSQTRNRNSKYPYTFVWNFENMHNHIKTCIPYFQRWRSKIVPKVILHYQVNCGFKTTFLDFLFFYLYFLLSTQ